MKNKGVWWLIATVIALVPGVAVSLSTIGSPNTSNNIVLIIVLLSIAVVFSLLLVWMLDLTDSDEPAKQIAESKSLTGLFLAAIFTIIIIVAMIGAMLYLPIQNVTTEPATGATTSTIPPEVIMGLLVVLGVAVLAFLMFVIAAAFSSLDLTDKRQPMGLPPGSIRAFIALLLIMVWVISSTFLYRQVFFLETSKADVMLTQSSRQLAQQLVTTMGTLVVAVAGFYFGTSAVGAARRAVALALPVIQSIDPKQKKQGESDDFTIRGKNFHSPKSVRLEKDKAKIESTEIVSSDTMIRCKIKIDKEASGTWDLVVVNDDGGEGQLPEAFKITEASAPAPPSPDPATNLFFKIPPSDASAGQAFPTQPVVESRDANGKLVTSFNGPVTLALKNNPGSGTLGPAGNVTASAMNGVAKFSGLSIDKPGAGYTLTATSGNLTSSQDSDPFDITQ